MAARWRATGQKIDFRPLGAKKMPFQSKAQARFLFAVHPDIAKKWAGEFKQPSIKSLPMHKDDKIPSPEQNNAWQELGKKLKGPRIT